MQADKVELGQCGRVETGDVGGEELGFRSDRFAPMEELEDTMVAETWQEETA